MIDANMFEIYDIAWKKAEHDFEYIEAKQKRDEILNSSKEIQNFYNEKEANITKDDRKKMMLYQAHQDHMDVIIAKYMYFQGMKDLYELINKIESLKE